MNQPTNLELLDYALEGLTMLIGTHSGNHDAAEDLVVWQQHREWVEAELARLEAEEATK